MYVRDNTSGLSFLRGDLGPHPCYSGVQFHHETKKITKSDSLRIKTSIPHPCSSGRAPWVRACLNFPVFAAVPHPHRPETN